MSPRSYLVEIIQTLSFDESLIQPTAAKWLQEQDDMADDKSKTGQDRQRISLSEDYEVRDWCKSLGCTPEQLREAVKAVGNSADAVREQLGKNKGA